MVFFFSFLVDLHDRLGRRRSRERVREPRVPAASLSKGSPAVLSPRHPQQLFLLGIPPHARCQADHGEPKEDQARQKKKKKVDMAMRVGWNGVAKRGRSVFFCSLSRCLFLEKKAARKEDQKKAWRVRKDSVRARRAGEKRRRRIFFFQGRLSRGVIFPICRIASASSSSLVVAFERQEKQSLGLEKRGGHSFEFLTRSVVSRSFVPT